MRIWSLIVCLWLIGCSGAGPESIAEGGGGVDPALAREDSQPSKSEQLRDLAGAEYRVTFKPGSDWGQGYVAEIEIANLTDQRINNWRLAFDFNHSISSMWNGRIVTRQGQRVTVRGESHNAWIEPRGTVKFGFQGTPGNLVAPRNYRLTGDTPSSTTTGGSTTGGTTTSGGNTGGTTTGGTGTTAPTVRWRTDDDWGSGFVGTVEIINPGPADLLDWQVDVTFAGTVTNNWNTRSISHTGSVYRFGAVEYNRVVRAGSSVSFGFQGAPGGVSSLPVALVGSAGGTTGGTTTGGTTSGGSNGGTTTGGTTSGASTGGTTTGGTTSGASTGGATTGGGTSGTTGGPVVGAGYLHTEGARIVDEQGRTVRLTGVNWFGLETSDFAPHGLWARSLNSMIDQMAQEGYNCIRLPFCNQMLDASSRPGTINYALNPDLVGKTSLEIIDRIIARAQHHGMKVILDRHRPTGDSQSELWYTPAISEERWISDFEMLARRYQNNPTVIGFDLHNEPHGRATWGSGNLATDWRLAAQRAGNRILAVNPNLLIIVEGVETAGGRNYWWGGNLKAAGSHPVVLSVPKRVVYSTHDYPASVYNQVWFSQPGYPNNLAPLWDECWGYLVKQNLAPVLVGEFGTRYQTQADRQWLTTLTSYMQANGVSFTYWSWNPNSTDTGGLLQDDWQTIIADKRAVLAPLLGPLFK